MILEALFTPKYAESHPWLMILVGFIYASIGMFLGYQIQTEYSSMVMVFLTVIACMPLIYNTIRYEEKKDEKCYPERRLLCEHYKALKVFLFLFFGMCIAFSAANIFLPLEVTDVLFSAQTKTITSINGATYQAGSFFNIFANNIIVLFFCVFFSLLYGLGAIYILTWNASVIGTAIGELVRTNVAVIAQEAGLNKIASYFSIYSCAYFIRYLPHGILEIAAYFLAGLGMGIVSIAIVRHAFTSKKFATIFFDSAELFLIAVLLLITAAAVEVYLTPQIFIALCT